jgi:hypothetical protein
MKRKEPDMNQSICPTCQKAGKPVETLTLKALLAVSLTELRDVEYHFCPTSDCSTVYFSADGSKYFGEAQLRERVYQKHPDDPNVFVCYCFRHTIESIKQEPKAVVAAVTQGIKAGLCACDIRNPQGTCCLGNVRKESV